METEFKFDLQSKKYLIIQTDNKVSLSNTEIDAFIDFIVAIEEIQNKKEQENVSTN